MSQARIEEQHNLQNMSGPYSAMEAQQLANLANNNDTQAQEEIMNQCLKGSMTPLLASLINPFRWEGIKEKACQDERYPYLLLHVKKQANTSDLYKELLEPIKAHATLGDPLAQTNLGYMYHKDLGVKFAYEEAVKWYTAAARQGYAVAQNMLGYMYQKSLGISIANYKTAHEDNYKKALEWYTQAAKQSYAPAQTNLGHMYQEGKGTYRRYKEAIRCYKNAVAQGDVQAKFYLGNSYYDGKGVTINYTEAFKWFTEAASQGHAEAQTMLGLMYNNGDGVERDFTIAAEWYRKAANQGNKTAQIELGELFQKGRGVSKDLAQAIYWFMRAEYGSGLFGFFKPILLLPLTAKVYHGEIDEIESNLLKSWQDVLLQEEKNQAEAYGQLQMIMSQFKEWRLALDEQPELMVSCLQFREQRDNIAIENYEEATGEVPYVKQQTLCGKDYVSFGEKNVKIAEAIAAELTEKTFYNQVQCILKQLEVANGMQEEQVEQFDRYYTIFLEEIEQGQYVRNQKFQKKYPYFFS